MASAFCRALLGYEYRPGFSQLRDHERRRQWKKTTPCSRWRRAEPPPSRLRRRERAARAAHLKNEPPRVFDPQTVAAFVASAPPPRWRAAGRARTASAAARAVNVRRCAPRALSAAAESRRNARRTRPASVVPRARWATADREAAAGAGRTPQSSPRARGGGGLRGGRRAPTRCPCASRPPPPCTARRTSPRRGRGRGEGEGGTDQDGVVLAEGAAELPALEGSRLAQHQVRRLRQPFELDCLRRELVPAGVGHVEQPGTRARAVVLERELVLMLALELAADADGDAGVLQPRDEAAVRDREGVFGQGAQPRVFTRRAVAGGGRNLLEAAAVGAALGEALAGGDHRPLVQAAGARRSRGGARRTLTEAELRACPCLVAPSQPVPRVAARRR